MQNTGRKNIGEISKRLSRVPESERNILNQREKAGKIKGPKNMRGEDEIQEVLNQQDLSNQQIPEENGKLGSESIRNSPIDTQFSSGSPVTTQASSDSSVTTQASPGSPVADPEERARTELPDRQYWLLGGQVLLFALLARLFRLGERVLHHDESIHGHFTLKLLEGGQYSYNPAYHGPFLYHSTAEVFHWLGISDVTCRLVPVLFGVAVLPLIFLLRKEIGKRGVLASAFLLAFSPSMVYFSRFFRNDMIIVFCTLAAVAGGVRYLENRRNKKRIPYLILSVLSLALAVTAKENAYIIIAMFGGFFGLCFLYIIYSSKVSGPSKVSGVFTGKNTLRQSDIPQLLFDLALAGVLFVSIVMFFYTSYFRTPETLISVVERAFAHWMKMHEIERLGGPFYYYVPILLKYEIPIMLFGTAGLLHFTERALKKGKRREGKDLFFLFTAYWALASFLLYSYLQEKVPWLVVHIVLPFGILAGAYIGEVLPKLTGKQNDESGDVEESGYAVAGRPLKGMLTPKRKKTIVLGILILTVGFSLYQGVSVNYYKSMDPEESLTYTQASPDIREIMEKIDSFESRPEKPRIYVVDPNNLYWPLPWYLRDYEKAFFVKKTPLNKKYDAVIVPATYNMYREIPEEDYLRTNFTLRPGREFSLYYRKESWNGQTEKKAI